MIESLEDYKTHFEIHIPKIKNLLQDYSTKKFTQQQSIDFELEKEISGVNSKIVIYETTLRLVDTLDAVPYKRFLAELKKDMFDIEREYKRLTTTTPIKEESKELFGNAGEQQLTDLSNMEVEKVIQIGDEYQDKAMKVAEGIERKLKETHEVADNVIIELDKIDERLKFVSNELDRADSTTARLKKYVNYFNRHYMSDKAIVALIICVLVLIIIILICSFVFKFGNGSFVDKVKK